MKSKIIYEDETLWVIYKPAGFATQSAKVTQPDVVSELKQLSKNHYVGLVHRLDQPVEGLLVAGKNPQATAALSRQLGSGELHKSYYAVVYAKENDAGLAVPGQGAILCDYIQKDARARLANIVTEQYAKQKELPPDIQQARLANIVTEQYAKQKELPTDVQQARLSYQIKEIVTEKDKKLALADISIETGRFHQIRAQMAHANLPLLGDQKYASKEAMELSQKLQVRNVALCAYKITFLHPKTKKEMEYTVIPKGLIFQKFQI